MENWRVKSIFDVDKIIEKEYLDQIKLADSIIDVNEATADEVREKINAFGENDKYVTSCAKFATSISLDAKKYLSPDSLYENKEDTFENKVKKAIKEDDIDTFVKLSAEPDFDPKNTIKASQTYMQMMAFYKSVKCFKYALLNGSFDDRNISSYAIAGGNNEIIRILEHSDYSFDNCINVAINFHRHSLCDWLLNNYKNNTINLGKTLKYFNDRMFFFAYFNNISLDEDSVNYALIYSIKTSNKIIIKFIIEKLHANINAYSSYISTPLNEAIRNKDLELVKYLVEEFHANINYDNTNNNAVTEALKVHSFPIFKYFIEECKYEMREQDIIYFTRYIIGFDEDVKEIIRYFISKFDFNVNSNRPIITYAVKHNNLPLIKFLVDECDAKIDIEDRMGRSVLEECAYENNNEICKYFMEKWKCKIENSVKEAIKILKEKGDIEVVRFFVFECESLFCQYNSLIGDYISYSDEKGLKKCFNEGRIDMVQMFINYVTRFEVKKRWIPSDEEYNYDIINYYIAEIKKKVDERIRESLIDAIKSGSFDIIKYLINECKANNIYRIGDELLQYSVREKNLEMIKFLINECNFGVNSKDISWRTALTVACKLKKVEIVKYLVEECNAPITDSDIENSDGDIKEILLKNKH